MNFPLGVKVAFSPSKEMGAGSREAKENISDLGGNRDPRGGGVLGYKRDGVVRRSLTF